KMRDNITVQKTFRAPNDRLSAYKAVKDNGIFEFQGDTTRQIKILVSDSHENVSVLAFNVRTAGTALSTDAFSSNGNSSNNSGSRFLQYDKPYRMSDDGIIVSITENSFYDNVNFTYSRREMPETLYSDLYDILDRITAIHKPYKLSIKPKSIPPGLKEKLAIVSVGDDGRSSYAGGEWSGEYLVADLRGFGVFSVGIDTISPTIRTNGFRDGIDLTGRRELKFNISDDFSGIKSYEAYIDDKWVLFEYDPKNTLITHRFDAKRIEKGKIHSFQLRVTDNRNNITELNGEFKW
ncbi:MAG: hypothetical protein IH591_15620, partial [Bacteroidales bacterium]|nr:hypothetical protein [Bacteroidales bacterium]